MSRRGAGALVALSALCTLGAAPDRSRVDFLYIEPNAGTAAAGHTAIRFGDRVYHFQNDGADRLVMVRSDADTFRYKYTVPENRPIHVARVGVDAPTYEGLRDRFNRRYRVERKHFELRDDLRADRRLVEHLLDPATDRRPPAPLRGAGYFLPAGEGSSPALRRLRRGFAQRYGEDFLEGRRAAVEREIRALPLPPIDPLGPEISADASPPYVATFSRRFAELSLNLLALEALLRAPLLREETLRRGEGERFVLRPGEARRLQAYAIALEERIPALVDAPRPDWGRPALVAMARLAALDESLRSGRLVLLDTFPPDALVVEGDSLRARREFLAELHAHASRELAAERAQFSARAEIDERAYQALEEAANRFLEYRETVSGRDAVRMHAGFLVPAAEPGPIALPLPLVEPARLQPRLALLREREQRYSEELGRIYGYDLIGRNCVSEIFETIDAELEPAASVEQLGGHVSMRGMNFVPRIGYRAVLDRYRVVEVGEIPSLRRARLEEMYAEENPLRVFLRESNTLTSSLYRPNDRDSLFLFFTDAALPVRPLFGAVNLVAGLAEAVTGLLRLPFDGGRSLVGGVKGAVFSLPELFFVNIRKGSFEYARDVEPRTRLRSRAR